MISYNASGFQRRFFLKNLPVLALTALFGFQLLSLPSKAAIYRLCNSIGPDNHRR